MEIKFKFIDDKNIKVMGVEGEIEKEVGSIFTPSSSNNNITNAIQVCGAIELFDFWGCSRYVYPRNVDNPQKEVIQALKGNSEQVVYAKDVQIMFSMATRKPSIGADIGCNKCFNRPCTCERNIGSIPYVVKTEAKLKGKLQYKEGTEISDELNKEFGTDI
jgi:hypothetical protein